jgi:hypothetical protein
MSNIACKSQRHSFGRNVLLARYLADLTAHPIDSYIICDDLCTLHLSNTEVTDLSCDKFVRRSTSMICVFM